MQESLLSQRIERLRTTLDQNGMRTAILSRPQHVYYFSGVMPGASPALLIITQNRMLGIAPIALGTIETILYSDYDIQHGWNVSEAVGQALEKALNSCFPLGRVVGLELDHFPAVWMPVALRHLREPRNLKEILWYTRRIKDAFEIQQIQTNIAGNDRMFQAVQDTLRPGISEWDVWAVIQNTLNRNAGEPVLLEADLGVGAHSSNSEAKPGPDRLRLGDIVFVDVYSATHYYYADTTRVFVLGEPNPRQCQVHSILEAALKAGESRLKAGMPANQVDSAVRGVIEQAGFGPNFPHHSGHAYGLFQQEKPYLIPAESCPLETGMVVTLEPGIYIPGWGGMRLEGNYLIGPESAQRIDQYPSELIVCG